MQNEVVQLYRELASNDPRACGHAPRYVIEAVLDNLRDLAEDPDAPGDKERVSTFVRGAIRFVADECGAECDILLRRLSDLQTG